jgi:hypothetical protein
LSRGRLNFPGGLDGSVFGGLLAWGDAGPGWRRRSVSYAGVGTPGPCSVAGERVSSYFLRKVEGFEGSVPSGVMVRIPCK